MVKLHELILTEYHKTLMHVKFICGGLATHREKWARLENLASSGKIGTLRLTEDERLLFKVNSDCIAVVEGALQHLNRQRIQDIPLDGVP